LTTLQRRFARSAATILPIVLGMGGALAGAACGSSNVTAPTPPSPSPPPSNPANPSCQALNYPGATGGARIQNAINDQSCSTVYIHPDGPDAGGVWLVSQPLMLRSNQTITTAEEPRQPTLRSAASIRILMADRVTDVTLRRLTLDGARTAVAGVLITGSARVEFTLGRIVRMTVFGIVARDTPSSQIRITRSVFEDNGMIDVRTQTLERNTFHANVVVEDNTMSGTTYGLAFANCGGSAAAACQARNNQMKPKRSDPGTGLDLNRSHAAIVSGNRVIGLGDTCAPGVTCRCGRGFTVDDTQNAMITGNTIEGCTNEGILLGNGAVPENRPWYVSGNTIADNIVRNNSGAGMASFHNPADPFDNNIYNVFRNNRLEGNAVGGCATNTTGNTFFGNGPQACLAQVISTGAGGQTADAPTAFRRWLERPRPF
jgi:hypothetical protein